MVTAGSTADKLNDQGVKQSLSSPHRIKKVQKEKTKTTTCKLTLDW